jgi:hypothetical protein
MSIVSIIVNILATIALIIIMSYSIYYVYNYFIKKQNQYIASITNPPGPYMQNSGIKCPDYWINTGIDSNGNNICKNSFNIETINPIAGNLTEKCNSDQLTFTPTSNGYTWEMNNPNGLTSYSDEEKYNFLNTSSVDNSLTRCQWINNCGPSPNVQGIWSGVNEICNNPPVAS